MADRRPDDRDDDDDYDQFRERVALLKYLSDAEERARQAAEQRDRLRNLLDRNVEVAAARRRFQQQQQRQQQQDQQQEQRRPADDNAVVIIRHPPAASAAAGPEVEPDQLPEPDPEAGENPDAEENPDPEAEENPVAFLEFVPATCMRCGSPDGLELADGRVADICAECNLGSSLQNCVKSGQKNRRTS